MQIYRAARIITSLIFVILTGSLLSVKPARAACNLPTIGNTGLDVTTCTYAMTGGCSITTDTTEQYTCGTTETATTNAYTISVGAQTLTVTQGTSGTTTLSTATLNISSTGSVAIGSSAQVVLDNAVNTSMLWVADGDADGYSSNFSTTYTATASGRRLRNLMLSTTADCNDAAYSTTNTCYGAFYPAFYPAFNPYGGFSPYGTFYPVFSP